MLSDCCNRLSRLHALGPMPSKNHEPSFSSSWCSGHDRPRYHYHFIPLKNLRNAQMERFHHHGRLSSYPYLHFSQILFCLGTQWCLLGFRNQICLGKPSSACSANHLFGYGRRLLLLRNSHVQIILVIWITLLQSISWSVSSHQESNPQLHRLILPIDSNHLGHHVLERSLQLHCISFCCLMVLQERKQLWKRYLYVDLQTLG